MSIFGIGIDIVQIDRIESSIERFGITFVKKILHDNEFEKFSKLKYQGRYLAKRFAAKESFAKALGTGIVEGVSLPKIEVVNTEIGKPHLILHDAIQEKLDMLGIRSVYLSISDEKDYAIAQVILEK